jgi:integrase
MRPAIQDERGGAPTLRIFAADLVASDAGGGELLSATSTTLCQLFEAAYEPLLLAGRGLSAETRRLYVDALHWWRELTGDPVLAAIDDFLTADFVRQLSEQQGRRGQRLSVATIRKHCAHVDAVLAFAGPRTREAPRNRELLAVPPRIERPRADVHPPAADWQVAELDALHAAAGSMRTPRGIPGIAPAAWWRSLVVVALHTALRIGQLLGLRYSDVAGETIAVGAAASKGRRGRVQYLSADARAAIEAIRTDRELIFPWPHGRRWLQRQLKRLAALAGLPKHRRWGFHAFRRTHATLLADASAGGGIEAARISLGHGGAGVTCRSYVAGRVQTRLAAEVIERLPSLGERPTR